MNMTGKISASFVAVAALSAVLFTSTSADSMKPDQSAAVALQSSAQPATVIVALNAKETPESQLKDLQY